jgi:hypothetical protein
VLPVSSAPLATYNSVSQCASVPGFEPVILTGRNLTATALLFDNFELPNFSYSTNVVGFVIARQSGGSPQVSDQLLLYSNFVNALFQDIVIPPGDYTNRFTVDPVTGVLKRIPAYIYTSGAPYQPTVNATAPLGLLYLSGTRNATVAYANPSDGVKMGIYRGVDGTGFGLLGDRTAGNDGQADFILDMKGNRIRVGTMLLMTNIPASTGVTIWGSNSIEPGTLTTNVNYAAAFSNSSLWTQISAPTNCAGGNVWTQIPATDQQTFWSFLRVNSAANVSNSFSVIEFMASSIQSVKQNMVP